MNESILLVEDEKALRTTLSDRLRSEGYVVETAGDGREGFDKASDHPFDLIILDVMLSAVMVLMFAAISALPGWPLRFCSSRSGMKPSIRWWALSLAPMIM